MKEHILELIKATGLQHRASDLERVIRPAIRMKAQPMTEFVPATSRLAGEPDLPPDMTWPDYEGVPMSFVGQINLEQTAPFDLDKKLPARGMLYFFCDALQRRAGAEPGDRGSWAVRYWDGELWRLKRTPVPEGTPPKVRFAPYALEFSAEFTMPPLSSDYISHLGLIGFERHLYWKLWERLHPGPKRPGHRLLGHAYPVQAPMEEQCQLVSNGVLWGDVSFLDDPRVGKLIPGLWDWRLLLQVDSDPPNGLKWGDAGGAIYYWIHQQDLRVQRFETSWFVLQGG
ncbi:MAG: DUF1963 domain-containing protein [Planctomycetes bacterium]|nr:DUF1963 domain-containing protein [Planctomycetota bacterium]